jgi:hypothetical protein
MGIATKKENCLWRCHFLTIGCIVFVIAIALSSLPGRAQESQLPVPASSRFLDELDTEHYPEVPAPKVSPVLRWDFSGKKVYSYDFVQKTIGETDMGNFANQERPSSTSMDVEGLLLLKSQGNKTATLVLKDMIMNMRMNLGEEVSEPRTMTSQAPPLVIQGVQEDGKMKLGLSAQELFLKELFPIPPKALKVGESIDVPSAMPFNAMGSLLSVTGKYRIALTKYVSVDGHTCARLETDIDISDLDVPAELTGDYKCSVKGKSVFYFDIENRCFVSGKVVTIMSMRVNAPTPTMMFQGESAPVDFPDTIQMAMDNDTYVSLALTQ